MRQLNIEPIIHVPLSSSRNSNHFDDDTKRISYDSRESSRQRERERERKKGRVSEDVKTRSRQ